MLTEVHVERVERLHAVEFLWRDVAFPQWRRPQTEQEMVQRRLTEPALAHGCHCSSQFAHAVLTDCFGARWLEGQTPDIPTDIGNR